MKRVCSIIAYVMAGFVFLVWVLLILDMLYWAVI